MMKPCPRCGAMLAARLVDSPEFSCPRARADKRSVGSVGGLVTNSLAVSGGPFGGGFPPPPPGAAGAASAVTINIVTPARTDAELSSMRLASYAMLGDIARRREQQGMRR